MAKMGFACTYSCFDFKQSIEIKELLSAAEEADVKYQQYLSNEKQWEETQQSIIGTKTTEGSIEFCKAELAYLQTGVHDDLDIFLINLVPLKVQKLNVQ